KEKVVYQQIELPVVQDRDYTLKLVRSFDPATHVYEHTYELHNELGPPEDGKHARIQMLSGRWTVSPAEGGGSDVVYQVLTEPGPSIQTWVQSMAQKKNAPELVKAMIARCAKTHASAAGGQ